MNAKKMTHAEFWSAVHSGHFHTAQFVKPTHELRDFERVEREDEYYAASKGAPHKTSKAPSRRSSKQPNSGFHRGMYWNTSRGYATDGKNHRESGNDALLRAQRALGV